MHGLDRLFYEWLLRTSVNKNKILIQTYFLSEIKNIRMIDPVSFMQKKQLTSPFLPELSIY